jgi:hypothetical protein
MGLSSFQLFFGREERKRKKEKLIEAKGQIPLSYS